MTNAKSAIVHIPYEKAYENGFEDMRHREPDITRIKGLIGFKPEVELEEMLRHIIKYFEK